MPLAWRLIPVEVLLLKVTVEAKDVPCKIRTPRNVTNCDVLYQFYLNVGWRPALSISPNPPLKGGEGSVAWENKSMLQLLQ